MNNQTSFGLIDGCGYYSKICRYKCCQQDLDCAGEINPGNYLLIYPGELADQSIPMCDHIKVISEDFNGGSLGFCDASKIDQSKCSEYKNYKTLDCRSYPFAPAYINKELVLIADERCPIIQEKELNRDKLNKLYDETLLAWQQVILENEAVIKWILLLNLPSYKLYER